jgi:protein-S-isoprenylcysteine O-methyltransferase Ste14
MKPNSLLTGGKIRIDVGRLVMVPAACTIIFIDAVSLRTGATSSGIDPLRLIGAVLALAFYAVLIWCYLRRDPPTATSPSFTAHAAAISATWLPFALPFLRGAPPVSVQQALSDVLLVCGGAWSVWSLRFLGRNVSVLAQARAVVDRGPYRWVRHPLYAGEIVSSLGVAVAMNSLAALACWLVLCGLQVYRAMREEQLLVLALPAYREYRVRTGALLPGVFWRRARSRSSAPSAPLVNEVQPSTLK